TFAHLFRRRGQVWEGVEVHAPYISQFHLEQVYDHVHVQDIVSFVPATNYDVVFLGDVLEHLQADDVRKVLSTLLVKCKYAFISIPLDAEAGVEQLDNSAGYWKNMHEHHLHRWDN